MEPAKKAVLAWSLYDFANSAYASVIPVLLFPLYYKTVILSNHPKVDLFWGLVSGGSIVLSGLCSPFLGILADLLKKRRFFFILTSLIAILGTASLAFSGSLSPLVATLIFILTNLSFNLALNFYDALLGSVSNKETSGKISSLGYALGYGGGIIATLLVYPFLKQGVDAPWFWLSFVIVAVFYVLFALPSFFFVKEREVEHFEKVVHPFKTGLRHIFSVFKEWRSHKQIWLFLLASYFLTEGIVTLSFFIALYTQTTLHLSGAQIAIFAIFIQVVAVPATLIFGRFTGNGKYRTVLIGSIFGLLLTTLLLGLATNLFVLYLAGFVGGLVIGSSQAIARAWYTHMVPAEKRAMFFGFNTFASKISTTIGPPVFGLISVMTGSQRLAIFFVGIYFIISLVLFLNVKESLCGPVKESAHPSSQKH